MGLANLFTVLRIILLPFVIYCVFQDTWGYSLAALLLFLFIILSDVIDSYITKYQTLEKLSGSVLDPITDKIVLFCLLIVFFSRDQLGIIPLLIFFLRDFIVNSIRTIGAKHDIHLQEDVFGKANNFFMFALVLLFLFQDYLIYDGYTGTSLLEALGGWISVVVSTTIILCVISIITFGLNCYRAINTQKTSGERLEQEDLIILANKMSRGYRDRLRRKLLYRFAQKRKAPVYLVSPETNMYEEFKSEIKSHKQIIIAGGDGSFESALNNPLFKNKVLGFFPLGAGNAFYSYFYRGKKFMYLRSKFKFYVADLNTIRVEWDKGKRDTAFMSIGIDAEVMQCSSRASGGFKDYFMGGVRVARKARGGYDLELDVDNKKVKWENCTNLTLGKIPFYGYGMRSMIHCVPNDELVYGQAVVNNGGSPFLNKFIRFWALIIAQLRLEHLPLVPLKGKVIEIKSDVPFPLQAGGEFLGYTHSVKVRVVKKHKVLMI